MVLGRSIKEFDRLGGAIKEAQASTRNITTFQKLKQDLSAAETAFQQARGRLATLRREMQNTVRPTRQMRAKLALAFHQPFSETERLTLGEYRFFVNLAKQIQKDMQRQAL